MKIYWMQPGKIDSISGGYIYNKNIIEGIRAHSIRVELFSPGTNFPSPSRKSLKKCKEFFQTLESQSIVIIDSLIFGAIPDLIEEFTGKLTFIGMIHLPLSLNPDFINDEKKNFEKYEKESFKHANTLVVTSEFSKSKIIKMGVDEEKIHVISPGINTKIKTKRFPNTPQNILCVSRISSSKGQLDLIKALENLQKLEWNMTFCGGYDEQDEYYKKIKYEILDSGLENRIKFTGEISPSEIEEYYNKADLVISTSYFETYSMVLQEAMAFRVPIISTNSGAATQTADSQVAKFYKAGDIKQLEKQLALLLSNKNEYKKLANGYDNLNLEFDNWNKKAEQFLSIIEKYNGA